MKIDFRFSTLAIVFAIGAIGCSGAASPTPATEPPARPSSPATAQVETAGTPASALVDHSGDSTTTAVEVPADAPDGGVPFENDWIFDRYGRFRKRSGGTGTLEGRRYDVIRIELADHSERVVYFDITDNWNRWSPGKP